MAVVSSTLLGGGSDKLIIRRLYNISDGTELSGEIIYNNSAFIANTGKGKLNRLWLSGSFTGALRLHWDHGTDISVVALGQHDGYIDFRDIGGFPNSGLDTPVGDLLVTSIALAAGDEFSLIVEIDQS